MLPWKDSKVLNFHFASKSTQMHSYWQLQAKPLPTTSCKPPNPYPSHARWHNEFAGFSHHMHDTWLLRLTPLDYPPSPICFRSFGVSTREDALTYNSWRPVTQGPSNHAERRLIADSCLRFQDAPFRKAQSSKRSGAGDPGTKRVMGNCRVSQRTRGKEWDTDAWTDRIGHLSMFDLCWRALRCILPVDSFWSLTCSLASCKRSPRWKDGLVSVQRLLIHNGLPPQLCLRPIS